MITRDKNRACLLGAGLILLAGCAEQYGDDTRARMRLERPIDCRTADTDIQLLQNEKASVDQQALAGVRSVFPTAAVAGILAGGYYERVPVVTGEYSNDIDAKIQAIEMKCQAD